MKAQDDSIEQLASTVFNMIKERNLLRGDIRWNDNTHNLEYFAYNNEKVSDKVYKGHSDMSCIFVLGVPKDKFNKVAKRVQELTLSNFQLGSVPTIPHSYTVWQDRDGNSPQSWWFDDRAEFDKNLVKDPFGRWVWRRTGILLSHTSGPAIIDTTTGEQIFVKDGWETKLVMKSFGATPYRERLEEANNTTNSKIEWIEIDADDQAPPVLAPYNGPDLGSVSINSSIKLSQLSDDINSVSPNSLFNVSDGERPVFSISSDGVLTVSGATTAHNSKVYGNVDQASADNNEEAPTTEEPESSGWAAPLACLIGVGLLGVLASKSKSANISKSQPATQEA